ncbi:unnamed protein product, partial [marine sediment metagenome]
NFFGIINNVEFEASAYINIDVDQGYFEADISPIPEEVGYDLQCVDTCVSVFSFCFAKENDGCNNGFSLTGGVIENHGGISFESEDYYVVNNYLLYEGGDTLYFYGELLGDTPDVSPDEDVEIEEYNVDWIQQNSTTIVDITPKLIYYINNGSRFYDLWNIYFYFENAELPFPQTLVTKVYDSTYDPNSETLHFEIGSNLFPTEEKPILPYINGQISGEAGAEYFYEFYSRDENNLDLYYYIDWGDGTYDKWIGPFNSCESIEIGHSWDEIGKYTISVKVKNINGLQSDWSTLKVNM